MRCASGVTRTRQRAVGGPSRAGAVSKARGPNVVAEDTAQFVVPDLADIGGAAAEAGHAGDRVGGGTARAFDARTHEIVKPLRRLGVDQGHRPLLQALLGEEDFLGVREHVDNGVPDREYVRVTVRHGAALPSSGGLGRV